MRKTGRRVHLPLRFTRLLLRSLALLLALLHTPLVWRWRRVIHHQQQPQHEQDHQQPPQQQDRHHHHHRAARHCRRRHPPTGGVRARRWRKVRKRWRRGALPLLRLLLAILVALLFLLLLTWRWRWRAMREE